MPEDHTESTPDGEAASTDADHGQRGGARLWVIGAVVIAVVLGGGAYAWSVVNPSVASKYEKVSYIVPTAPRLTARTGETVYRIDPTQSKASYGVDEKIVGTTAHHANGSTQGIAGDLAVNPSDPSASRVGQIVIDVEEFHSDNNLRDARIRKDFLESAAHPLATFSGSALTGLPATLTEGHWYTFNLAGQLTVKGKAAPVTWRARAQYSGGKLLVTATTQVKMSTYGVGPISIAGLVSTSDDVSLSLDLTALDPSKFTVPTVIAAPSQQKHSGGPSFSASIQPILEQSCASCHNAGQVGAAHWQLSTAGDASAIADGIGVITKAKYMPPWPASDKGVPLAHSKALSQQQISLLSEWAADGGQLDVPDTTPIVPSKNPTAPVPRKDVVLPMPQTYAGSLSKPNDYRCFVLDPKFTKPTYVTGFTFSPDQVDEIHHAQIFHIAADNTAQVESMQGKDGKPGFQCYVGPLLGGFSRSTGGLKSGLIAAWAPGQDPTVYPEHAGLLMEPGDVIALQVHYHYDKQPTPDRSTLSLQTEPGTANLPQVRIVNPIAPVEIPCDPGVKAPLCNRDAAIAEDGKEYGPIGQVEEGALLQRCGKTAAELAATFKDGKASSTCDFRVPVSGQLIAVMGHMHTLGSSIDLTLDPDTPQQKLLLDIPTWNFDWQMNYQLATPIHVTQGDTIRMSCTWDRSLDPNRPPKYIVFAEGTEDEMCFSTYQLIPDATPKTTAGG